MLKHLIYSFSQLDDDILGELLHTDPVQIMEWRDNGDLISIIMETFQSLNSEQQEEWLEII
ncbi:hypothetical protein IMZ31_21500 (plasmid) [Pontibacillus sp. ALD_SL1]|uniref:hypothetical protein n=1 Tax=Pontibacillus sp. ALD_SL1 TaxID=2777185 RepID=UPI001A9784EB|nr:hypothetical protein [Pontibacillus sp. ALD_SL1]QST02029.1 hypothetical protein IMZ31_21500 [Pontibacillus sp. ALD_SL1]